MRSRVRRGAFGFGVALVGLSAIGATYQAIAAVRDREAYPPPGQMVDMGGYRLHLQVAGAAQRGPTVILDAGIASFSPHWHWVQTEIANTARVVAYDRAGLGWSDPGPGPNDVQQSARELHAALAIAGIEGPYVVAGHSYGGLVSRAFADLYPDEVVGMVLVDASHPDQWARIPEALGGRLVALSNRVLGLLAGVGLIRIIDPITPQTATGLPAQQFAEMKAIFALPKTWSTSSAALSSWDTQTRAQIDGASQMGNLPLVVLSVTEQAQYANTLTELQSELPALSTNSIHRTIQGATHENLIANVEHARFVAAAIYQVLEAARTGQPLSARPNSRVEARTADAWG